MDKPREAKEVSDLKLAVSEKAEKLVMNDFPKKIQHLGVVLEGDMFDLSNLPNLVSRIDVSLAHPKDAVNSTSETAAKVCPTDGACGKQSLIPSNPKLLAIVDFLKPEIVELADRCSQIKEWIQLMVPKIEDGNNFGVSVQGSILSEVSKAEGDALSYLQQVSGYFNTRAQLLAKVIKHPQVQDYQRAVDEYDQRVFINFRLMLKELRSIYAIIYDVILKNYEKLKNPRTYHDTSMY